MADQRAQRVPAGSLWEGEEIYAVAHLMHQYSLPGGGSSKGQSGRGHHAGLAVYGCKGIA